MDYGAVFGSVVVLIAGILLILNGRCSQPNGFSATAPVCVGSHLSVQVWLAVVGLEFSLLGSLLLPRFGSIIISKSLTRKLTTSGVPASRLMNSFSSAPIAVQFRGMKGVLILRVSILAIAAAVGVLYKFSFVSVDAQNSTSLPASLENRLGFYVETDNDYTSIGYSDVPRFGFDPGRNSIPGNILSANLVDFMTMSNGSVIFTANGKGDTPPFTVFPYYNGQTDMVVGPKVNMTRLSQIINGTVHSCEGIRYMRVTYYSSRLSFLDNWNEFPNATETPSNNQVRIQTSKWNQSDHQTINTGAFMDITSLSNGSLQAWSTEVIPPEWRAKYDLTDKYDYRITVNMQYCFGYITWDNLFNGIYVLNEPRDIQCQSSPFDVEAWNQTLFAAQAKGFIQASVAGEGDSFFWARALPIISILLPHADMENSFTPYIPLNPLCSGAPAGSFAVAEGIIKQSRTGATGVGVALQVVVVMVSVLAMGVMAWPMLPLVTEWPAQWLALSVGLDKTALLDAAGATSTGKNAVRSDVVLLLENAGPGGALALSVGNKAR